METWSLGNAVLQGMGLEMTIDFLFFDLPDTLLWKWKWWKRYGTLMPLIIFVASDGAASSSHLFRPLTMKAFPEC